MPRTVVVTPKPDIEKPVDMPLLGAYIRHHRTHLGLTLEDAAALCEVSKQTYNNIVSVTATTPCGVAAD